MGHKYTPAAVGPDVTARTGTLLGDPVGTCVQGWWMHVYTRVCVELSIDACSQTLNAL